MKRPVLIAAALAASFGASAADNTTVTERDYNLPTCAAPVASVVVGEFKCKSANCMVENNNNPAAGLERLAQLASGQSTVRFPGVGEGMSAMLTTALKKTGCFDIQEREALNELQQELELVGKKVEVQQADFMISGSVTSINLATQSKSFGGGFIPVLGSVSKKKQLAELSVDLRIIDVNRAKLVDSITLDANNTTSSTSWGGAAWAGIGGMVGGMSNIKGTPMEEVLRDVLIRAASYSSKVIVAQKETGSEQQVGTTSPVQEAATATPASVEGSR